MGDVGWRSFEWDIDRAGAGARSREGSVCRVVW